MQTSQTFSVKISVLKNFTSATVFSVISPNFRYLLTLTCSSHFRHLQNANIRFSKVSCDYYIKVYGAIATRVV